MSFALPRDLQESRCNQQAGNRCAGIARSADARLIVEIKSSPRTNLASSTSCAREKGGSERDGTRKLQVCTSLGVYDEGDERRNRPFNSLGRVR